MESDRLWRRLGRYVEKWKCNRCFIDGSEESVAFLEYIQKLKNGSERTPNSENSSRSKSRPDQSCAECLKELRDENGRLSRRVQCLDCLDVFHFSCTEFGDENIWQRVGDYRNRWKCKNCSGFDSDSVILREKLNEVKRSLDIPVNIV
ncbi:uncharacterized protein LOC128993617 [Macrosteles quadrilineatus]|uniref:uncharacterized protein LOC128993617 n=1 Tax=Macrosteles quadrilineatus TaxID=74068 RepID=UPI0023E0F9EA|nr:uncharacterized protein LOC128993617 [Macrosteles quadrilineatus]